MLSLTKWGKNTHSIETNTEPEIITNPEVDQERNVVEYCEVEIEDARMEDDDVSSTPDHKGGLVCKCK